MLPLVLIGVEGYVIPASVTQNKVSGSRLMWETLFCHSQWDWRVTTYDGRPSSVAHNKVGGFQGMWETLSCHSQ